MKFVFVKIPTKMQSQELDLCEWCGFRKADDAHHLFRRSTSPKMVDDPNNIVRLCRVCHGYATNDGETEQMFQWYFFLKPRNPEINELHIAMQLKDKEYISPRDCTRYRSYLSGAYMFGSEQLIQLEKTRPFEIEALRPTVKSDKRAEIQYDMTENGQLYNELKSRLKVMEKMMSALRAIHEQYQRESSNQY